MDGNETIVDFLGILGIEVERPVDPGRGIPLLLLALVVEREELGALVLVFPGERGRRLALERPGRLLHGELIPVHGGHAAPPLTSPAAAVGSGPGRRPEKL